MSLSLVSFYYTLLYSEFKFRPIGNVFVFSEIEFEIRNKMIEDGQVSETEGSLKI